MASTSEASLTQLYCIIAARTAAWNTRGPDRMSTLWMTPPLTWICAWVFNDEPFGPIAALRSFNTLDEAIAEANRLPYGLAGYAFTGSLKNADLLVRRVEVGMLWVNMPAMPTAEMPFGGIKDSGYGSEGGCEAMEAYLNARAVTIMNV